MQSKIGQGGFGTIFRVRSLSKYPTHLCLPVLTTLLTRLIVDNNTYVMKEVPFEDNNSMETALQEKQLMSRVNHKHICKYVDSFVANGSRLYLIMEYCDKGDLEQYLQRLKRMAVVASTGQKPPRAIERRSHESHPYESVTSQHGAVASTNTLTELGEHKIWRFFI